MSELVRYQLAKKQYLTEKITKLIYPNTKRLIIFISYDKAFRPIISSTKISDVYGK